MVYTAFWLQKVGSNWAVGRSITKVESASVYSKKVFGGVETTKFVISQGRISTKMGTSRKTA